MTTQQPTELKKRLKKIAKDMRALIKDAGPGANIFVANNTLNLMAGDHHAAERLKDEQKLIIASEAVRGIDGGDW